MPKVLVTGASGMIGAHIIDKLLKSGYEIKAMKREQSNLSWFYKILKFYGNENLNRLSFFESDLFSLDLLKEAMSDCDAIVHCAAKVSLLNKDANELHRTNHQGTANLVNTALLFPNIHFIQISSVAALGKEKLIHEKSRWKSYTGVSAYSITKHMAEMEVWRGGAEGLKFTILNPSYVLGPGNWYTGSPSIFRKIKNSFKYYTTGITGFVDARDVADAVEEVLSKQHFGQNFIINAENSSYQNVLIKIAKFGNYTEPSRALSYKRLKLLMPFISLYFFLRKKTNPLNRSLLKTLFSENRFDNTKSIEILKIDYRTIDDAIVNAWKFFESDIKV